MFKTVTLKPGKDAPLRRRHPWIFSGALQTLPKNVVEGDLVSVRTAEGEVLAFGYYQTSSIAVRVLDFSAQVWESIDLLLTERIQNAIQYRQSIHLPSAHTNAYRLIHGEGDQLSGLIIDLFDRVAVVQAHTSGMAALVPGIVTILTQQLGDSLSAIVSKGPSHSTTNATEVLWGTLPDSLVIAENDGKFLVSVLDGQKTGFFLDQRDTREYIRTISKDKRVLNLFCYTGGFSVAAIRGGARFVTSVDSSSTAVELLKKNISLNLPEHTDADTIHTAVDADVFDFLKSSSDLFELVICDPPAFAKHASAVKAAIKGYWKLNREVIKTVAPHGRLATFSCSQLISTDAFESAVLSACADSGRSARVIRRFEQSACHPVSIFHSEARYLKGVLLQFD